MKLAACALFLLSPVCVSAAPPAPLAASAFLQQRLQVPALLRVHSNRHPQELAASASSAGTWQA